MSANTRTDSGSGVAAIEAARVGAGLVPSKTSRIDVSFSSGSKVFKSETTISFAAEAVAMRRVKRLKKSVWASGHLHGFADKGHRAPQCWFVTLTYVGRNDWRKEHMSACMGLYRKWCKRLGVPCRYTWVAELQGRGAVHYHLLCWLPQGVRMPHWDRPHGKYQAFWPHGMTNTDKALSGVGYLMKYLSKLGELTKFPKGLRLYGIGGLDAQARGVRSWLNLPEWVKRSYGVGEVCRKRMGLVVRATGELLEPAFSCKVTQFSMIIIALRELPARFHDGAYSTFPRATA